MPGDVEKFPALETLEWRPSKRRRHRAIALRFLMFALGLYAFYHVLAYEARGSSVEVDGPAPIHSHATVEQSLAANGTASEPPDVLDDKPNGNDVAELVVAEATVNKAPVWPQTDIETSLRRLFSILPDEFQTQILLQPIATTGEERLRELGLRTRYFSKLFEAWEVVHLVSDEDRQELYIRDDIIQYIQRHPRVAAALDMTTAQVIHSYEACRSVITRLSTLLFPWSAPYYPDHMHLHTQFHRAGKGIVFSAGDNQAPFLLTSIPAIRELGCRLPIEVMYLGDRDLSESVRGQLEALPGVTTRDLSQMVNDRGWQLAGWAGKPFAILLSSFREVIFIDADSLFFQNPERLFADEAYLDTGALFFKDRLIMPQSKRKWLQDVLPKPISPKVLESRFWTGESGHMQESGVVVVDTWRHFVALLLVTRMNGSDRDGNKAQQIVGVYDMLYGDKETFWLGWELVGDLDYAFHDGDAGIMGGLEKEPTSTAAAEGADINSSGLEGAPPNYTICAPQLLHLDRHGRPLWFNGWLLPNKFIANEREPTNFEVFLQEPREVDDPAAWQLHEHNVCCLTSEYKREFTHDEREILDMIIAYGRLAGALGKYKF
ncbi:mannosyltransferase putative-domain-containing protein [Aspergillus cavernicola]|uniref:Mannosyltransferase putative-domain-containing protein n=1 Tax=Aspergillus cavernicola TaxID=176166 RepID=A0ABR4HUB3_9EURO